MSKLEDSATNKTLQDLIYDLQSRKAISVSRKAKLLAPIIKAFNDYTKDTQEGEELPTQTLIPCCLFSVPRAFEQILGLKEGEALDELPAKKSVQIILDTYLKAMLKLLENSDNEIRHVVVEGMSRSILLTLPFPKVMRRWIRQLTTVWAREGGNMNLALRAFLALRKVLTLASDELFMWALRRLYVSYFEHSSQVSWRNLEHINFMVNGLCEVCRLNQDRAYYVFFGYVRSIALQLTKANKAKRKDKVDLTNKLFSNQILSCFRLFTAVVSRVESQDLTALIYPLIELTVCYEKTSQASQYIPLKLHLVDLLLTLSETTGVFVPPVFELLQRLLQNKLFLKKLGKHSQKVQAHLELSYKLSPADLANTSLINQMFQVIIGKVYWFLSLCSRQPAGAELIKRVHNLFKKLDYPFSGYKTAVREMLRVTRRDVQMHYQTRLSQHVAVNSESGILQVEKALKQVEFQSTAKYLSFKQEQEDMLKKKLLAENEQQGAEDVENQEQIDQSQGELNDGWEEAQSGASDFQQEALQSDQDEDDNNDGQEKEDISYQGDPQDIDQHIRQWSEQEWSSQGEGLEAE